MSEHPERPDLPEDLFDLPTSLEGDEDVEPARQQLPEQRAFDELTPEVAPEAETTPDVPEEEGTAPPEPLGEAEVVAMASAEPPPPAIEPPAIEPEAPAVAASRGLFDTGWGGGAEDPADDEGDEWEEEGEAASLLARLQAGCADLLVHVAVVAGSLIAMNLLQLQAAWDQWPGFLAFLALFSFLYLAFPLAFWGQTPGMAWFHLRAREDLDQPLAFGQTGLRVVGAWLTCALLGLPTLLTLFDGRSLVDRLSGSLTLTD